MAAEGKKTVLELKHSNRSLVGHIGESWVNLGENGRAAEICVDLWGAVESLWRAVGIVGVSSASHEIKRKCMDMSCTDV